MFGSLPSVITWTPAVSPRASRSREVAGQHDDAVEAPGRRGRRGRRAGRPSAAPGRSGVFDSEATNMFVSGVGSSIDEPDAHAGDVEGDAEAEQEQQDGRQDEGDDQARRIAQRSARSPCGPAPRCDAGGPARSSAARAVMRPCSRSCTSISPMKASSSVGLGSAARPHARLQGLRRVDGDASGRGRSARRGRSTRPRP